MKSLADIVRRRPQDRAKIEIIRKFYMRGVFRPIPTVLVAVTEKIQDEIRTG